MFDLPLVDKIAKAMNRNEAIGLLERYNTYLMDSGYADSDMETERPTAIEGFLNEMEQAQARAMHDKFNYDLLFKNKDNETK